MLQMLLTGFIFLRVLLSSNGLFFLFRLSLRAEQALSAAILDQLRSSPLRCIQRIYTTPDKARAGHQV